MVSSGVRLTEDINGIENSAYNFSNYGDRIFIGEEDLFSGNNAVSISFWMQPKNGGFPVQPIFYNNQVDIFYHTDHRSIEFSVYSIVGGLSIQSEVNSIPDDKWSFIVCTYDGVESKIYLNCKLIASFTLPDIEFNMPLEKTYLGSGGDGNSNLLTFYGDLDEVMIFDRGIAYHEVLALYRLVEDQGIDNPLLLSFGHPQETGAALIDIDNYTVFLEVVCNSELDRLSPVFQLAENAEAFVNGSQQFSGVSINNFTDPVNYILANEQVCVQQEWVINITTQEFTTQKIEEVTNLQNFTVPQQTGLSAIENNSILIEVPCKTDLSKLIPSFQVAEHVSVFVRDEKQISGLTSQNFYNPVVYQVGDDTGCYSKDWVVQIRKQMLIDHIPGTIPNAISPNNDSKNDYFIVPDLYLGSELMVLNRYGKQVYHSLDYQNDFQGNNLSAGVYFFLIQNECLETPYMGTLSILR
jgi:hypothetical protein